MFHLNSSLARPVFQLILVAVSGLLPTATLDSQNLIPSLEDVIGPPPEPEEKLTPKKAEVFYSLGLGIQDPRLKYLRRSRRGGSTPPSSEDGFSPEDQSSVSLNIQPMSMSGNKSLITRVDPEVLIWVEKKIRTPSGARLPFIFCYAHAVGPFPVAFVMDPEIAMQMKVGEEEYSQFIRGIPPEKELPYDEPFRGRYITHNPIGNQLMAHGVAVVIPILNTLENLNGIPIEDWQAVLDYILSFRDMDAESVFLVSTREYTDTAFRLASQLDLEGFLVEEPESGIFGASLPATAQDAVAMTELIKKYQAVTGAIDCPILIMRHKQNPILKINDIALLNPLISSGKKLYLSITDRPLRTLEPVTPVYGEEMAPPIVPQQYAYDVEAMKKLVNRLLHFVQQNGASPLRLLPQRSRSPRIGNRSQNAQIDLERIERRMAGYTQDSEGFNSNNDSDLDGNVSEDSTLRDFGANYQSIEE